MIGPLTYAQAVRVQESWSAKVVLAAAVRRGLGDRVAFRDGQPTPRTRRLLAFAHCRTAAEVMRHVERHACCQYCGGAITDTPTCPNCGIPREEQ